MRYDEASARWWKYTKPDAAGLAVTWQGSRPPSLHNASPLEYLERLHAQNAIFDDGIRLEGLWRQGRAWRIITSQPHIPGSPPSLEEITTALLADDWQPAPAWNGLGYKHSLTFRKGPWLLSNAHPGNFVKTSAGSILPIDVILTRHLP